MSVESCFSHQNIRCDECGEDLPDYGKANFWTMLADAKVQKWTIERDDQGLWNHFCPVCRPEETRLERAKRMLFG